MEDARPPIRTWFVVAFGLTLAWVAFLARFGPKAGPEGLEPPALKPPGSTAVTGYAWPLRDLDDRPVDFARFRGRPILLNLWATWCGPCVLEMPSIAKLANNARIKRAGVAVVCVSTDQSPEALRRYVAGESWSMTILRATALPAEFATDGIPATFLIDTEGRIVASQVGAARWDDPSVIDSLEKLASAQDRR